MKVKNRVNKISKILSVMFGISLLVLPITFINSNKQNLSINNNSNHNQLSLLNNYNFIEEAWTSAGTIIVKDTVGEIWAWGIGTGGQNGDGDSMDNSRPEKIEEFSETNTIEEAWTMFNTFIAKDTVGDIWSWGIGTNGQNGDGDPSNNPEPVRIHDVDGAINVFGQEETIEKAWTMNDTIIAKGTNDEIWSWGIGDLGQNGDGQTENNNAPEKITQFNSTNTIEEAWTMADTIIAKDTAGSIWAWGNGAHGQNGDGERLNNPSPNEITEFNGTNTIEEAWTMDNTIIAKDTIGDIWTWGSGIDGQNGNGNDLDVGEPAKMTQFNSANTIVDAWTMSNTIIAKDSVGDIWSWGDGIFGQNGDGETIDNTTPERIHDVDGSTNVFGQGSTIDKAWTMFTTIIAKDTDGNIWSWGYGLDGQNGDGETTNNDTPEQITQFSSTNTIVDAWTMANTIIAKDTAGDVWSWGSGTSGQNGDGETTNNNTPEKIFSTLNSGTIKMENITSTSATVIVEGFVNGIGNHDATKATLTYGVSGGTSQTMDDTNLDDGISFNLTGLTEGQSYNLSIAYFNASDFQIGSPITPEVPLVPQNPPKSGLSTGAIIGIAVGVGGAVLIGGGVGGFFLYKKKKGL